ncbi:MAG: DUF3501 family protein [Myxococcales bacterium]|nr:DUF3501 family protein [Myxococcales bacterium]
MNKVQRTDLLDYVTYAEKRDGIRNRVLQIKIPRRVHVGDHFTFLFENRDTMVYQIQEMMRVEHLVREADILHELDTYNEVLGGPGELGCTLLIEIEDPKQRADLLRKWLALPQHVFARLDDGTKVYATFDLRQIGLDRLSSVHYIKFPVGGRTPAAVGIDLQGIESETELSSDQQEALAADLADSWK